MNTHGNFGFTCKLRVPVTWSASHVCCSALLVSVVYAFEIYTLVLLTMYGLMGVAHSEPRTSAVG